MTREERRHQSNGIWLCQIHGKQVDSDEKNFTVETLRAWKQVAEGAAADAITRLQRSQRLTIAVSTPDNEDLEFVRSLGLAPEDSVETVTWRVLDAARSDVKAFKAMPGWPGHPIVLDLTLVDSKNPRAFDVRGLALATNTFNEISIIAGPGTGKTTTVLQLADHLVTDDGVPTVYIPLGPYIATGCCVPECD